MGTHKQRKRKCRQITCLFRNERKHRPLVPSDVFLGHQKKPEAGEKAASGLLLLLQHEAILHLHLGGCCDTSFTCRHCFGVVERVSTFSAVDGWKGEGSFLGGPGGGCWCELLNKRCFTGTENDKPTHCNYYFRYQKSLLMSNKFKIPEIRLDRNVCQCLALLCLQSKLHLNYSYL